MLILQKEISKFSTTVAYLMSMRFDETGYMDYN